jgi:uncharacterized protein (DUF1800 family)
MTELKSSAETGGAWASYRASPEAPWDLRRVVHLHRRAGFAATREELERDLREGPEASIDRFLNGQGQTTGVLAEYAQVAERIGDAAVDSRQAERLKAWWVLCMLEGPDALGERLTLMWHNHFATSNRKVDDLDAMRRQNDLLRRYARAPFAELLNAAVHDPALLIWLDAPANRKGHPNENLARELLELFTLGIGAFGENDVKESARALAGWTLNRGSFFENLAAHDKGEKTVLTKRGRWNGADLIRLLVDHPATARRLAGRLCETFMGEGGVSPDAVVELAEGLRSHELDIGWGVATVLRSRAFFATENLGARVVGPVEFVIGAVRALKCLEPPPSTLLLAEWITRIGQDLFYPPNVGGWPGGRTWLSSRGMIARVNFATALAAGHELGLGAPPDILGLVGSNDGEMSLDRVVGSLAELVLGALPGAEWRTRVVEAAAGGSLAQSARRAAAIILASPEAQLA